MKKICIQVILEGDASMIEELEKVGELQVYKYACEDETSMFITMVKEKEEHYE